MSDAEDCGFVVEGPLYECSACKLYIDGQKFICKSYPSHWMCQACAEKLDRCCPCGRPVESMHEALARFSPSVAEQCDSPGCSAHFTPATKEDHRLNCVRREVSCPLCAWSGSVVTYANHVVNGSGSGYKLRWGLSGVDFGGGGDEVRAGISGFQAEAGAQDLRVGLVELQSGEGDEQQLDAVYLGVQSAAGGGHKLSLGLSGFRIDDVLTIIQPIDALRRDGGSAHTLGVDDRGRVFAFRLQNKAGGVWFCAKLYAAKWNGTSLRVQVELKPSVGNVALSEFRVSTDVHSDLEREDGLCVPLMNVEALEMAGFVDEQGMITLLCKVFRKTSVPPPPIFRSLSPATVDPLSSPRATTSVPVPALSPTTIFDAQYRPARPFAADPAIVTAQISSPLPGYQNAQTASQQRMIAHHTLPQMHASSQFFNGSLPGAYPTSNGQYYQQPSANAYQPYFSPRYPQQSGMQQCRTSHPVHQLVIVPLSGSMTGIPFVTVATPSTSHAQFPVTPGHMLNPITHASAAKKFHILQRQILKKQIQPRQNQTNPSQQPHKNQLSPYQTQSPISHTANASHGSGSSTALTVPTTNSEPVTSMNIQYFANSTAQIAPISQPTTAMNIQGLERNIPQVAPISQPAMAMNIQGPASSIPLSVSHLENLSASSQRQVLGERLYPLIQNVLIQGQYPRFREYPDLTAKITGMLLETGSATIVELLGNQVALRAKVAEAVGVLEAHRNEIIRGDGHGGFDKL